MRWSYSSRAWIGFLAALPNGVLLCRHELTWRLTPPEVAAEEIKAKLAEWKIPRLASVIGNPQIFPTGKERGRTDAEMFQRAGLPLRRGSGDRLNAWASVRSWLATRTRADGTKGPMLLIHPDCKFLLRTLPTLVSNPTSPDDVHETTDEYPALGLALCLMARPAPSVKPEIVLPEGAIGHWVNELRHAR